MVWNVKHEIMAKSNKYLSSLLWIYGPAVQVMGTVFQSTLNVLRIGKGAKTIKIEDRLDKAENKRDSHETKAPWSSRLVVLHDNAVDDLPITTKVSLQALRLRVPA